MRFPIRFTSDFQLGVAARILRTRGRRPLILDLQPIDSGVAGPLPRVDFSPSLVWIRGSEPLEHPEIAKFANAVAASGREMFLQTNGKLFRRRVHEFQPSPRLRLAFRALDRCHQVFDKSAGECHCECSIFSSPDPALFLFRFGRSGETPPQSLCCKIFTRHALPSPHREPGSFSGANQI